MEYYLVIKRNEIGSFIVMWMDLESIIQSQVSQKVKKMCINAYIESRKMVLQGRNRGTDVQNVNVATGWGKEGGKN